MTSIDTSSWKEFRIGDIFDTSLWEYGKNKEYEKSELNKGLPVVSGITINNGVRYYTEDKVSDKEIFEDAITITTRGEYSGTAFYHEGQFLLGNNILVMPIFNLTKKQKLFLVNLLNKLPYKGYNYYPTKESLKEDKILLPYKEVEEPDWEYMEQYMKDIENRVSVSLTALQEVRVKNRPIDVREWKEFRVGDLFDIVLPIHDLQAPKLEDGEIPLVSSGKINNGICKYIKELLGDRDKIRGNVITIDMFGKAFYQESDFYSVSHGRVNILYPKFNLTKYIGLYFVSLFDKSFQEYSFTEMCTSNKIKNKSVFLPVDIYGVPNFKYMEKYMKEIELKQKEKYFFLNKV